MSAVSAAPVLPDHVKKPNEEEFKKELADVNANIEKIQKQFVSFSLCYYYCYYLVTDTKYHNRMLLERRLPRFLKRTIMLVVRKSRLS